MANSLRDSIAQLATSFVTEVLAAVRGASLEDLASETGRVGRPPGRRAATSMPAAAGSSRKKPGPKGRIRRSAGDIAGVVEQIVALLKTTPGLGAEQIRTKLELASNELPRPIAQALAEGKLRKTGEKRATRYFVGGKGGGAVKAAPAKTKRKPGRKKGSKNKPKAEATASNPTT